MKLLHIMIRVSNLERSIEFYTKILNMRLLKKFDNNKYKYTLAFVGYSEDNDLVLELTYNWGEHFYEIGTAFGHLALGVKDIFKTCEIIHKKGIKIIRKPGAVKGGNSIIAFIQDPDGYKIELVQLKNI